MHPQANVGFVSKQVIHVSNADAPKNLPPEMFFFGAA